MYGTDSNCEIEKGLRQQVRRDRAKAWNKNNPERRQKNYVNYMARLKAMILEAYGSSCSCCGETNPGFLTIDHIYNDGAAERKKMAGQTFYIYLKNAGFPKDRYRLLCMNCNWGRRQTGKCPHSEKKDVKGVAILQTSRLQHHGYFDMPSEEALLEATRLLEAV